MEEKLLADNLNPKLRELIKLLKYKENRSVLDEFYKKNKNEIDLNSGDADERTPLIHSVVNKNSTGVNFLLDKNANVNKTDSVKFTLIVAWMDTTSLCLRLR